MMPPATAANTRNRNPLPRKTVAKKRSSSSPRRSDSTPMNRKKAMPAKGRQVQRQSDCVGIDLGAKARLERIDRDRKQ